MALVTSIVIIIVTEDLSILTYFFLLVYSVFGFILLIILFIILFLLFLSFVAIFLEIISALIIIANLIIIFIANFNKILFICYLLPEL